MPRHQLGVGRHVATQHPRDCRSVPRTILGGFSSYRHRHGIQKIRPGHGHGRHITRIGVRIVIPPFAGMTILFP